MRKAPWADFDGNPIFEGDFIVHPDGDCGEVVFESGYANLSDQWRVRYEDGSISRLCLQIGDRGQAVVDSAA